MNGIETREPAQIGHATKNVCITGTQTRDPSHMKRRLLPLSHGCYIRNRIIAWCNLNRLIINSAKTKHLYISNKKQLVNTTILKDQTKLGNVDAYEYLGFSKDRQLTMSTYIDKIIKKVSYKIHTLSIIRRCISEKTSSLVHKVMIMPHFEYVDFVIDSAT